MSEEKKYTHDKERRDVDLSVEKVYDRNGRRIDDAYVVEAVDDLDEYVRVGRPSLGGRSGSSPRVSFRITEELKSEADALAHRKGKSLSELARDAFEKYVHAG